MGDKSAEELKLSKMPFPDVTSKIPVVFKENHMLEGGFDQKYADGLMTIQDAIAKLEADEDLIGFHLRTPKTVTDKAAVFFFGSNDDSEELQMVPNTFRVAYMKKVELFEP